MGCADLYKLPNSQDAKPNSKGEKLLILVLPRICMKASCKKEILDGAQNRVNNCVHLLPALLAFQAGCASPWQLPSEPTAGGWQLAGAGKLHLHCWPPGPLHSWTKVQQLEIGAAEPTLNVLYALILRLQVFCKATKHSSLYWGCLTWQQGRHSSSGYEQAETDSKSCVIMWASRRSVVTFHRLSPSLRVQSP